jgi:ABC-type Mn2+/Zn2+ transport system ATPase subunit
MKTEDEPAKSRRPLSATWFTDKPTPSLTIIAGPNGSGKSTFVNAVLGHDHFINEMK